MSGIMQKIWNSPYILLVVAASFWGGNAVVGRFLAGEIPPITISFIRIVISVLIIVPFIYPLLKKEWPLVRQHIRLLVLLSVTGVIGYNLFSYWALNYTTAINVTLLNSTSPIFMIFLAYLLMKEKLNVTLMLSILVSMTGVIWVMSEGSLGRLLALQFNIGDLIMLVGVFSWAVYSIYIKKSVGKMNPLALFGFISILAMIILIPFTLVELWVNPVQQVSISMGIALLYLGIFPSIFSFLMWNRAVRLVGPSTSSVFLNLTPVFAAIMAYFVLDERITMAQFVGGIMVFLGVYIASRVQQKPVPRSLLSSESSESTHSS